MCLIVRMPAQARSASTTKCRRLKVHSRPKRQAPRISNVPTNVIGQNGYGDL